MLCKWAYNWISIECKSGLGSESIRLINISHWDFKKAFVISHKPNIRLRGQSQHYKLWRNTLGWPWHSFRLKAFIIKWLHTKNLKTLQCVLAYAKSFPWCRTLFKDYKLWFEAKTYLRIGQNDKGTRFNDFNEGRNYNTMKHCKWQSNKK